MSRKTPTLSLFLHQSPITFPWPNTFSDTIAVASGSVLRRSGILDLFHSTGRLGGSLMISCTLECSIELCTAATDHSAIWSRISHCLIPLLRNLWITLHKSWESGHYGSVLCENLIHRHFTLTRHFRARVIFPSQC